MKKKRDIHTSAMCGAVLAHLGGRDANDDITISTIALHETGN